MNDRILMAHGSGGILSRELIEGIFKKLWHNKYLEDMLDGARIELPAGQAVISTDSFVVTPRFFPGGDIGKLSICGTVNDLVACGAKPLYLAVAFIIEEGFRISELQRIAESMAQTARQVGIKLVTGDTKVVEKNSADGLFINTTGIGVIKGPYRYDTQQIKGGDKVIVTGFMGDHGLAILARREGLSFETPAVSDCAPLHEICEVLEAYGAEIRCMRDPTRGGLATALNELADQSGKCIRVDEAQIPITAAVKGACEMLGMDPLYMANEGKMIIIASPRCIASLLADIRRLAIGENAEIIGEINESPRGMVLIKTRLGSERILAALEGEHIPRIC
jgi:hydrogenase expression/formation protein HypE